MAGTPYARLSTLSDNITTPELIIYTDGACVRPGGKGSWAGLLLDSSATEPYGERTGCYGKTTNQRMEVLAAVEMLEHVQKPCKITLYSDSKYLVDGANNWVHNWAMKGWKKNADLWKRMLIQIHRHRVYSVWVKGHSDNKWNNRCDSLASSALNSVAPQHDKNYPEVRSCVEISDDIMKFYKKGKPKATKGHNTRRACATQVAKTLPYEIPAVDSTASHTFYTAFSRRTDGSVCWAVNFYSEGDLMAMMKGVVSSNSVCDLHVLVMGSILSCCDKKTTSLRICTIDALFRKFIINDNKEKHGYIMDNACISEMEKIVIMVEHSGDEKKAALVQRAAIVA